MTGFYKFSRRHGSGRVYMHPPALKLAAAILAVCAPARLLAATPTERTIFSFPGGVSGGTPMMGTLIQDKSGALYGTASGYGDGATESWGVVYKLTPSVKGKRWSYSILCKFNHESGGGRYPIGGLVFDPQGNLYGGTANGVVFELSPPTQSNGAWSYQTLWSANAGTRPGALVGTLLRARDGALYGTIFTDPENPNGAIFRLLPPTTAGASWTYQTLYSFQDGSDGGAPSPGVIADASGNLYGTAEGGSGVGGGTVFQLIRPSIGDGGWSFNLLYSFGAISDGAEPIGKLYLSPGGSLYGVTKQGGTSGQGVVFQLAPPAKGQTAWTESVIYQFASSGQGAPMGGVIGSAAGYLYGTTSYGTPGISNIFGTVYRLAPPAPGGSIWQEKTVVDFKAAFEPEGSLLRTSNGTFYGTSKNGGTSNECGGNCGTVFQVGP